MGVAKDAKQKIHLPKAKLKEVVPELSTKRVPHTPIPCSSRISRMAVPSCRRWRGRVHS